MDDDTQDNALAPYFFRDLETFQVLRNDILPALLAQAELTEKTLRLWSAGCSTGEDAYSLAILIADLLGDDLPLWNIRIFATDSDEAALNIAKQGIYEQVSLRDLSEEERKRWFKHTNHQYHISKILRKMVIIGQHNIAYDTPFAHIDLIMCRKALFTCTHERQQELIRLFAFSLAPKHGYLIMEKSANIRLSSLSFQPIIETLPIYQNTTDASIKKTSKNNATLIIEQLIYYKGLIPAGGITATPPISLQEVFFRLSPTGIVVIDRTYRIVTANRAAHRLCSLPEQTHLQDFLHSVPGLPYASVRSAIDTTFHEGNTQNVLEVELTLTLGGNGRVLNLNICLLPAEVTTPDYAVIYIQEITEQTVNKQAYHNMQEALQNIQLNYAALTQTHTQLLQTHTQLQNTSTEILTLYEQLLVAFEECQAIKETLEQDQAALQEELETVCIALSSSP
jgi:two-component system, chemotaxis family, CheB/CheR fusion protein